MFSVAIKGYGIVIWVGDGEWRTFGATKSLSMSLDARVQFVLETVPLSADESDVRDALLSIAGAGLLSADCEHSPGECDEEIGFN